MANLGSNDTDAEAQSLNVEELSIGDYLSLTRSTGDILTSSGERYDPADYDDLGDAFNQAVEDYPDTSQPEAAIYVPGGYSYSTDMVLNERFLDVHFLGKHADPLTYTGSGDAFRIDGAGNNTVTGLSVKSDMTAGANAVAFDTGTNPIAKVRFRDFYIREFDGRAFFLVKNNVNEAFDVIIKDGTVGDIGGDPAIGGTNATNGIASITLKEITSKNTISGDFIRLSGTGLDRRIVRCEAEPGVQGNGFTIASDRNHVIRECRAENVGGDGFAVSNADEVSVENCHAFDCDGSGFVFDSSPNLWANSIRETGSGVDGIVFKGGAGNQMGLGQYFTGTGIKNPGQATYRLNDGMFLTIGIPQTLDLSSFTPVNDGEVRRDDGTNFVSGEYAFADTTSGVWRAFSDPANNTVQY